MNELVNSLMTARSAMTMGGYVTVDYIDWLLIELKKLTAANACDCGGCESRCCSCGKYLTSGTKPDTIPS